MNYLQSTRFTCLLALLLVFAAGCGDSDEAASSGDEGGSSPTSSQTAPELGLPQVNLPEVDMNPRVEFQTTAGTFTVKLDGDKVPGTVENFLKYVERGFYDGTIIHQVTPGYAIVGGGYTVVDGKYVEKQGLVAIPSEAANGRSNQRGTIAMARSAEDADSARCQFFINLGDNSSLDYYVSDEPDVPVWRTAGYCAFGEVEGDGLAVVEKIANQQLTTRNELNQIPLVDITILSARKL